MKFEWDPEKEKINRQKHGISFKVAARIFSDSNRLEKYDESHSENEERWQALGMVWPNLLIVVFAIRDNEDVYRIISARKANANERKEYYNF